MTARRAVSLFTNCGAGDVGFARAGFRFEVLAEIDERRLAVAGRNLAGAQTVLGDLRETWSDVVSRFRERCGEEEPVLVAACPPCQGLSTANPNRGHEADADTGSQDARNLLVLPIAEVVLALRPRAVVVENVRAFLTKRVRHPETDEPVSAAVLLISLLAANYIAYPFLVDLADYGVPQTRVRSFITFLRRGEGCIKILEMSGTVPYPTPTHSPDHGGKAISLQEALDSFGLPALDAATSEAAISHLDLHFVPVWSLAQYEMVAAIPAGSGASAWENDECPTCSLSQIERDVASCPSCGGTLRRPHVAEDGRPRLVAGFRRSSYRRLSPDRPAATITTASNRIGSDRTIHPHENRVLSPLECQKLQTLPDDFDWGAFRRKYGSGLLREMIGEAVPPRFTELHGRTISSLLDGMVGEDLLDMDDCRVRKAVKRLEKAGAVF